MTETYINCNRILKDLLNDKKISKSKLKEMNRFN